MSEAQEITATFLQTKIKSVEETLEYATKQTEHWKRKLEEATIEYQAFVQLQQTNARHTPDVESGVKWKPKPRPVGGEVVLLLFISCILFACTMVLTFTLDVIALGAPTPGQTTAADWKFFACIAGGVMIFTLCHLPRMISAILRIQKHCKQ